MRDCPKCNGIGYCESIGDEYEPNSVDACYHCGTTGKVSDETYYDDRINKLAAMLSCTAVNSERNSRDSDPDGEGWAFCAAENMMSEYEYTKAKQYDHEFRLRDELKALNPYLLNVLLEYYPG